MKLITVERLRKRLGWPDVDESREKAGFTSLTGEAVYYREFLVRPPREDHPSITFIFADDLSSFGPLLIGPWHWDPYYPPTEVGKVRSAILKARRFMSRETHVREYLNAAGVTRSVGLFRAKEIDKTLEKDVTHFRKWTWAQAPQIVPVDLSPYVETEHLYVEARYHAKIERARKKYLPNQAL